jgi:hypothetical protein
MRCAGVAWNFGGGHPPRQLRAVPGLALRLADTAHQRGDADAPLTILYSQTKFEMSATKSRLPRIDTHNGEHGKSNVRFGG